MADPNWNPRYVAYCTAHGNTPEAQLKADVEKYPGGYMAGFILWMAEKARKFSKQRGLDHDGFGYFLCRNEGQDEYTKWLAEEAEREASVSE